MDFHVDWVTKGSPISPCNVDSQSVMQINTNGNLVAMRNGTITY